MKIRKVLFRESANLICWFRIAVSVLLAIFGRATLGWALLYSLAFISDTWDGWFYRRVPKDERPRHWFNRLPISMDPLADFVFVAGGVMYVADIKWFGAIVVVVVGAALVVLQMVCQDASDQVFSRVMTVLTYGWFVEMIVILGAVWYFCVAMPIWPIGFGSTLVVFYACFFLVRDKSRTIRKRG